MNCSYCNKLCKNENSYRNHERLCKSNPNRKLPLIDYSKRKTSNCFIKAKELGLPIPQSPCKGKNIKGHSHTEEFKEKQRIRAIAIGLGGVRPSRWINYKGKILGSSYELLVALSLDENNILWDTCKKFNYIDPTGKVRTYKPDIYLIDYDVYLDPKNDFLINNINPSLGYSDKIKIQRVCDQNNIKVIILDKDNLTWDKIKTLF